MCRLYRCWELRDMLLATHEGLTVKGFRNLPKGPQNPATGQLQTASCQV
jgi:hypothetical protein